MLYPTIVMLICHIYKLYVTAALELQVEHTSETMGKERKGKQREVKDGKAKKRMKGHERLIHNELLPELLCSKATPSRKLRRGPECRKHLCPMQ